MDEVLKDGKIVCLFIFTEDVFTEYILEEPS